METKFSKGEWHACCLDNKPHFVFAGEDGKTVCAIHHNDPNEPNYEHIEGIVPKEECVANAKLIQSAPELLESLEEILWLLDVMRKGLLSWQPTSEKWFNALNKAEAVIKKATE